MRGAAALRLGAVHQRAGRRDDAKALATVMIDRHDPRVPIVVDSADCGAAMKE